MHHCSDYDRDKWGFAAKTILKMGERMDCIFVYDVIVISNGKPPIQRKVV